MSTETEKKSFNIALTGHERVAVGYCIYRGIEGTEEQTLLLAEVYDAIGMEKIIHRFGNPNGGIVFDDGGFDHNKAAVRFDLSKEACDLLLLILPQRGTAPRYNRAKAEVIKKIRVHVPKEPVDGAGKPSSEATPTPAPEAEA